MQKHFTGSVSDFEKIVNEISQELCKNNTVVNKLMILQSQHNNIKINDIPKLQIEEATGFPKLQNRE